MPNNPQGKLEPVSSEFRWLIDELGFEEIEPEFSPFRTLARFVRGSHGVEIGENHELGGEFAIRIVVPADRSEAFWGATASLDLWRACHRYGLPQPPPPRTLTSRSTGTYIGDDAYRAYLRQYADPLRAVLDRMDGNGLLPR